jgi:hypothetical protein
MEINKIMNTYTWDFLKFNAHSTLNGREKVVFNIEFILNATDGEEHAAQVFGTVGLGEPTDSFVPFEQLTAEQVTTMVETALGDTLEDYKRMLDAQIQRQKEPVILELTKPWEESTSPT